MQAKFRPRFDMKVETGMIKAALRDGITSHTDGGDVVYPGGARSPEESLSRENDGKRPYPTGAPASG